MQIPKLFNKTERPQELYNYFIYLGQGHIYYMFLEPVRVIGLSYLGDN